ncbi:unnamed protein product [Vicia faba]|uniref:Reverse transcriptase zinc-binding domain-containing protein n=1 Tax=Vicia faba TaxID=3906 RepID=A0AAV1B3V8_VICFA|nr:unnamed protein product [Vicia faba]
MLQEDKFNVKKLYHSLSTNTPIVPWYKLMLHNKVRHRVVMLLWLVCHGKLATKARLHRFSMVANTQCVLCIKDETINHLFFGCLELKNVWAKVLFRLGYNMTRWNGKMDLIGS